MGKILKILNAIVVFGFLAVSLAVFVTHTNNGTIVLTFFTSTLTLGLVWWLIRRENLADEYLLLYVIPLWLNLFGELNLFYNPASMHYDKFAHLINGALFTAIIYAYYKTKYQVSKELLFFAFLGLSVLWEIYEFILWSWLDIPFVGVILNSVMVMDPYTDTLLDLIFGAIGSSIYLALIHLKK